MQTEKGTEYKQGGASAWYTLILTSLLYAMCMMDRQVFAVVLEPMKKDLGLSDSEAGILLSVFVVFMALFALPAGILVDRWSRKKSVGLMAIVWSAATLMTALGKSMLGVAIPRAFVGVGEAGYSSGGGAMITASFPKTMRSRAMAIFYMCSPLGIVFGSILGGYLSVNYGGWRTPFYVFAIPGILLGLLAFTLKDYKSVKTDADDTIGKGLWQNTVYLFKVPSMKWAFIGTAFFACIATANMYWAPAFAMRAMHIKEDTAGLIVGGLAIMGILGTFAGGAISDMWYKKNPKARFLVGVIGAPIATIGAVTGTWLVFSGQFVIGLILLGVYAFAVQMYLPGVVTAIQEVVHPGAKGLAQSMNVLLPLILAAPAPALVGVLSDALGGGAGGLAYGMMLVGLVALGAIPCLLRGAKYFEQDMDKVKHLTLEADK